MVLSGPLKRLAYVLQDQPSLLQHQSTSEGNMQGETHNHQTFCMRLVLVSFILLVYSCMFITIETLLHLKIASETLNHKLLGRGPRDRSHDGSVYATCACVIHTLHVPLIILSFHINVCVGYICSSYKVHFLSY